ncbi:hypothetical protein HYU17_01740 [Candidatus Woesearchaeota archaeon]|nr:hypothetical protein [Candidatus Woesearchaeota archaeon]
MVAVSRKSGKKGNKQKKLYVCGRCGYRSHHRMKCHNCGFHLEEECSKCCSAIGNCVCLFHNRFVNRKKAAKVAAKKKRKSRRA